MNLEYKGFWLSVKPIKGPVRYECTIVNIKGCNYDYKLESGSGFGSFYTNTDSDILPEFHKRVEALITLDVEYDDFNEDVFTKKYLDEILEIK